MSSRGCTIRPRHQPPAPSLLTGLALALVLGGAAGSAAAAAPRPLAVRIQWGGGQPQAWTGRIAVVTDAPASPPQPVPWRTLCAEPDAAAGTHESAVGIEIHQPRPLATDGVEVTVPDVQGWRLRIDIRPGASGRETVSVDVPVAELLSQPLQRPLDDDGNRLTVRPAPGELLQVAFERATAPGSGPAVCRPGERLRLSVDPLLPTKADGSGQVTLRMRLKSGPQGGDLAVDEAVLVPVAGPDAGGPAGHARFEPVGFEVPLPVEEGGYVVELEAFERGSLRWTRPLATRTVHLVAVADEPSPAPPPAAWRVVYELDPGSPKLHERLRRLPGIGLPGMAATAVPMPAVPLPKLPPMPVPAMPSLSSMVPRLGGLLATGHSRLEPHPLGPTLKLPQADEGGRPTWEAIVVAGAQPGMPHVVEIELPTDQDATLAAVVLEADATGSLVRARHAGGVELSRDPLGLAAPRLDVHRFVFWPASRQPLLVIANPSRRGPATFGRVRVLAGPSRLPANLATPAAPGRRFHAFFADRMLESFGGVEAPVRESQPLVGWDVWFAAIRNSADHLRAQNAAGAVVPVCGGGAAAWPSALLRQAPRWSGGVAGGDAVWDAAPKDVLEVLCRVYAREGLRVVPALSFDAPLPAVERLLVQGDEAAVGIACLGRDGRPRRSERHGGVHYNPLDPRVQAAVEEIVAELVGRIRGTPAVETVAVVLEDTGWLHLPGVAWGLDDVTFGRFLVERGLEEPAHAGSRFAARAALVEGPLREAWVAWRTEVLARFWGRLADLVADGEGRRSLAVVPTTLLADGEVARGLRPTLDGTPPSAPLAEVGIDPDRITAHPGIIYVAPHLHGGAGGLMAQTMQSTVNRVAGLAPARRRGVVLVAEPVDVDMEDVLPHGPFSGASLAGPCVARPDTAGVGRDRCLAEALVPTDAEVVFDMALATTAPATSGAGRRALESLSAGPADLVGGLPAPLVVRTSATPGRTSVLVINAGPAPASVLLVVEGRAVDAVDAVEGTRLPLESGAVAVPLDAWGMRGLWIEGESRVTAGRIEYQPAVVDAVRARVETLRARRQALEMPAPLDVLDNPGFELGRDAAGRRVDTVPGWELVEQRRGTLGIVGGIGAEPGQALAFSSSNGLSTLRSNPFARPASGRLSIAAWLRIDEGEPQPPLRMALEGVDGDREYYRFAAVGGLAGGKPLGPAWSQFVLQIDDLPETRLESLRVRFDLLGPGTVQIDEVRLFDLAFDESQRVRLSRMITAFDERLAAGDVGGCLLGLDGHWPRYLEAFVPDPKAAATPASTRGRGGKVGSGLKNWWK